MIRFCIFEITYKNFVMKILFTLISFVVFSYVTSAQLQTTHVLAADTKATQEVKTAADDVISLNESEFNFGKIPQGKPVTHIFLYTNTGKTPLILDNVQASCGCTTPEWSKAPVAPGAQSQILVGYNSAAEGSFTKSITITYNGTQTKLLMIKGEVWKTPATSAPDNSALSNLKNQ